jgi:iron only hydrogenase large subunit-like protein
MLGAMVKNYYAEWKKISRRNIAVISVMPCTAKKYEAAREELTEKGDPDVDAVITTRELASLIKQNKIKFSQLKDEKFDQALGAYSGAGIIFGSTGGVMEAALRTAYEKLTSREMGNLDYEQVRGERGIKEAEIAIPEAVGGIVGGITVRTAVAHEIGNAEKVLQDIQKKNKSYDFVEVMACPGGCLGGGGQPRPAGEEIRQKRRKAIYEKDKNSPIRKSHQNPIIQKLYRDYLGSPGGEIAEKLLHTEYFNKKQK